MTMVDWLLTEQLVGIFSDARAKRPELNAELLGRSPNAEADVLGGAGIAVRIATRDGGTLLVTPRRVARVVGERASDLVVFSDLVGYDWITPEMSEKVALKDRFYDRLYLYPRDAPPIVLDRLGDAVYPLMTFFGRVLEFRSQKVLLRKLDDDVVELVGRCLRAAADGPFFDDAELSGLFGRSRASLRVVAGMWPRMNLAAPELLDLVERVAEALPRRASPSSTEWAEWVGAPPERLEGAVRVFGLVVGGEV